MIMGVAPGLTNVGVAMVSNSGEFVGAVTIELLGDSVVEQIGWLVSELDLVEQVWCKEGESLNQVACESAYVRGNFKQAIRLAKVLGAVVAMAGILMAEFVEITLVGAREVLTGDASATKRRVLRKGRELSGRGDLNIHEAYALGVALVAWGISQPDELGFEQAMIALCELEEGG